jgi:hypothetical protein
MKKVEKLSAFQFEANFREIFDGETIEEATQKAHLSKNLEMLLKLKSPIADFLR